jgi:hypothetical protein
MNHATRSLVSAIAAIKVPKIYLFRSFLKGGKKHHNYYPSSGHSLVLAFEINSKFPHFLNDEEFKVALPLQVVFYYAHA